MGGFAFFKFLFIARSDTGANGFCGFFRSGGRASHGRRKNWVGRRVVALYSGTKKTVARLERVELPTF